MPLLKLVPCLRPGVARKTLVVLLLCAAVAVLFGCGRGGPNREARIVQVVSASSPDAAFDSDAANDTTRLWLGRTRARATGPHGTFIYHDDTRTIYAVDDAQRTLLALPIDDFGRLAKLLQREAAADDPDLQKQLGALRELTALKAKVRPTSVTGEVDGYDCRQYLVEMKAGRAVLRSEYWVTKEIHVNRELFRKLRDVTLLGSPGAEALTRELAKIDGLPVLTVGTLEIDGRKVATSSRIVSVEYGPIPDKLLALPPDYTIVEVAPPPESQR
jgi:hypothetical protein